MMFEFHFLFLIENVTQYLQTVLQESNGHFNFVRRWCSAQTIDSSFFSKKKKRSHIVSQKLSNRDIHPKSVFYERSSLIHPCDMNCENSL